MLIFNVYKKVADLLFTDSPYLVHDVDVPQSILRLRVHNVLMEFPLEQVGDDGITIEDLKKKEKEPIYLYALSSTRFEVSLTKQEVEHIIKEESSQKEKSTRTAGGGCSFKFKQQFM